MVSGQFPFKLNFSINGNKLTTYQYFKHTIFVAEVRQLRFRDGEPLVFCVGGYRQLAERELCA